MATTHNASNQDAVLKDYYTDERVKELSYGENVFYAMLKKERGQEAGGRRYVQPIEIEHPGGANASFADAMTDGTTSLYRSFLIDRKKQFQRVLVDEELLHATSNKRESFLKALDEFDRGFKGLGNKIGRRAYRTGGGALGKLSIVSTTTTTLKFADRASTFNFHIGQKLQFSATDGTGTLLDGGDFVTVTAISHELGEVTIDVDLATQITGVATTSFVFQRGDYGLCLSGLEDWLPVTDRATKLAASFFGVTRSEQKEYLGGVSMNGTSLALDEVLIKLVGKIGLYGGATSHIFANPETLSDMQLLASSKLQAQMIESNMRSADGSILVGFSGFKCVIGGRTVRVYGDRHCPSNRIYALQMNTWTLWYTGDLVNWLGEKATGSKLQPSQNEPSVEARLASWCNIGCSAPGWNGVAEITPQT